MGFYPEENMASIWKWFGQKLTKKFTLIKNAQTIEVRKGEVNNTRNQTFFKLLSIILFDGELASKQPSKLCSSQAAKWIFTIRIREGI